MFLPFFDSNPKKRITVQAVTVGLIVLNVAMFLVFQGAVVDYPDYRLALIPVTLFAEQARPADLILIPEETTLLSYAFLHGSWLHLAGNMLFLWVFGDNVEDAMGHIKFLIFFILCGIAGGLAYAVMTPEPSAPLVGASGATSGVVAAYLMLHPRVKVWVLVTLLIKFPFQFPAWIVLGAYVVWNVLMVLSGENGSNTAWWAHIGGLVAGAALTPLFKHRDVKLFDQDLPDPAAAAKR
ncbi:MAG: rhomboid family intramembrane serine protease [Rhizobiales bacterium]|nr:rhomboid family intramembrane serine protease [Hyphomicrobiales bacterium]MBO6699725.1 rhomboid family intramembrane serine protease [Hyphomicrobiales bacterium]MBO6737263.1 rhomboid family intramembrane serine protease [Hyphomicrobiales bacterium]MBO6911663.1 rhomboid family intramembrane serine protease [Hyphomicrobiales bacterium]MBO6954915.1 rhomboid family intramembrane serine protease [Hyphomicrobiales bacterium]